MSTQLSVSVVPTAAVAVRVVVSTNAAVGPTMLQHRGLEGPIEAIIEVTTLMQHDATVTRPDTPTSGW